MTAPWLGHENWCCVQWNSPICDCGDEPVDLSESTPEERPADDPWIPVCDGRDCGGRPHE